MSGVSNQHSEPQAYMNTDRELWCEGDPEDGMSYYEPSIHVTEQGGIGINVGGYVIVRTLREWHALAKEELALSVNPERPKIASDFSYYLIGSPTSRFAITRNRGPRRWRFPWQRPRGGWWLGPLLVWWST